MAEQTFEDRLSTFRPEQIAALQKIRKAIHSLAPEAEEGVSYGLPAFILNGKPLVGIGASAKHCSLFSMTGHTVELFKAELKDYETSKGAIHFTPEKPIPNPLLKKIVKSRMAEVLVMTKNTSAPKAKSSKLITDSAVDELIQNLNHPLKKEIEKLRQLILSVSPKIRDGVKWNSPSFQTTEWFATMNLRGNRLWLILHLGAKVKDNAAVLSKIKDPKHLLEWLGKDRAVVKIEDTQDLAAKATPLKSIIQQWIQLI